MKTPSAVLPEETEALARALIHFLGDRSADGRAELHPLRSEALEWAYTASLRLGIEAHALVKARQTRPV